MVRASIFFYLVMVNLLICQTQPSYGQHTVIIDRAKFNEVHEIGLQDSLWYFHVGPLKNQSSPLNTTGWDTLQNTSFGASNRPRHWRGQGWFAIWLCATPDLVNQKLALRINHDGASEIFLDGQPIGGYGKIGNSASTMEAARAPRDIIPLWLSDGRPHLLSIHYTNYVATYADFYGFQVNIGDYPSVSNRMRQNNLFLDTVPWFAAAQLILGLLHFFLFLFYPKRRINFYYALFVLMVGINGFGIYLYYQTRMPSVQLIAESATYVCKVLIMWSAVTLLYALNNERLPRRRMLALSLISLAYIIKYIFFPFSNWNDYFSLTFLICIADGGWSAYQIIRKKQKGVWLVGVGVTAVFVLYVFAWADVFSLWPYYLSSLRVFVLSAGELVLPICLSLYLALDFARTNQNLVSKLTEVRALSAQAITQEAEKTELIAGEAKRLEQLVALRTSELHEKANRLKELDAIKSRFFTNLTHEFRTPLTLIINPAKQMLKENDNGEQQQYLQLILQNATRLLGLINQLLDMSKLDSGLMEIDNRPFDLVAVIKTHLQAYASIAIQKQNTINFTSQSDSLWQLGDNGKMDMIVLNLLSNAMKFTSGGMIEVVLETTIDKSTPVFLLTVRDNGSGISSEKLPYIFERFYQADPSDTRSAEGSGIGLALTKELVELLGGEIKAESVEGLFTEIQIKLSYQPTDAYLQIESNSAPEPMIELSVNYPQPEQPDDEKPLVLLIEDNDELRLFMKQLLCDSYRIITATDGAEGVSFAIEQIPNLIITDLMMPNLNGYQVTDQLKSDEKTSHIPIIILTAKTDKDSRIDGIKTGADAYLAKPFDEPELMAQIENLLRTRNQLRERYSKEDQWFNDTLRLPSMEQDFVARMRKTVEEHLPEEGYNAESLAADMGLSRTQLHRKLKDLIGQAPGELIRTIRLQYAHDLLKRQIATVAEVAYMVGFSNPASFSASFSRHFGFPPKKVDIL
ncbi:response regulator [Mucilaginibacter agri]|uniref:histidine kinase n=1 Tax=Mucilaginibacter agri TaxID=2695265 RepID=A0A965ZGV3_9SPHI|nr:response regulator [Mucilaginibacter agri]NCD69749.1 response regulator [Mucilaginibacter agri]